MNRLKLILIALGCFGSNLLLAQQELINRLEWQLSEAKDDTSKINICNSISNAYRSVQPQKAIEYALKASEMANKIKYRQGLASAYLNLGMVFHVQEEYAKAFDNYLKALEQCDLGNLKNTYSAVYTNLANLYSTQREYAKARVFAQRAISVSQQTQNKEQMAKSLTLLAAIERKLGHPEEAFKHYNRCIELFDELGQYAQTAATFNNIGNLYLDQKQYDKADDYYKKSLTLYKRFGQNGITAPIYANISIVNTWLGNYDVAKENAYKSLALSSHSKNDKILSFEALRIFYEKTQKFDSAYYYFSKASTLKDSLFSAEMSSQISRMQLAYDKSSTEQELERLKSENELKALKIKQQEAEQLKSKFDIKQQENYLLYLETQNQLTEEALERKKLEEQQLKLMTEKQHQADMLNNRRLRTLVGAAVLIGLLAIVSALLLNRARRKQKQAYELTLLQKREIEYQKEEILNQQRAIERTNHDLQSINQQVRKSIEAAQVIQTAFLPSKAHMEALFGEYFEIYRPKDLVSGDFYWAEKFGDYVFLVVGDCTGHGVSGALMSMIGHALLDKIIAVQHIYEPKQILSTLDADLRKALAETAQDSSMDICVLRIEPKPQEQYQLSVAAAKASMYYAYDNEIVRIKGDNIPMGTRRRGEKFTQYEILVPKGTVCYMGTDGYSDQNDVSRVKIGTKKLREMFLHIHKWNMEDQKSYLIDFLEAYMKGVIQRDDILIVGVKL
jgi:serine phosphatase RsbU (regulator of sigma subunit)